MLEKVDIPYMLEKFGILGMHAREIWHVIHNLDIPKYNAYNYILSKIDTPTVWSILHNLRIPFDDWLLPAQRYDLFILYCAL